MKRKPNVHLLIFGIILSFLLFFSPIIHEIGHDIICKIYGNKPYWITYSQMGCEGKYSIELDTISKFFGGLFSSFVLGIALLTLLKIKRLQTYKKGLKIIFLDVVVIQLINALLESFLSKEVYVTFTYNIIFMLIILLLPLLFLTYKFDRDVFKNLY